MQAVPGATWKRFGSSWHLLWAVINNWAGYTTGGLIVALLWFWSALKQQPLSRRLSIALAVGFLAFAVFSAWREQYRARLRSDAELQRMTRPVLSGEIGPVTFGPAGDLNQNAIILIPAKIANLGAPSAIDNISAGVKLKSGRTVEVTPLDPPREGIRALGIDGSDQFFQTSDYLPRVGAKPIPTGGLLPGFVYGLLNGVTSKELVDFPITVVIQFYDVYGNRVMLTREITKRNPNVNPATVQKGTSPPQL